VLVYKSLREEEKGKWGKGRETEGRRKRWNGCGRIGGGSCRCGHVASSNRRRRMRRLSGLVMSSMQNVAHRQHVYTLNH